VKDSLEAKFDGKFRLLYWMMAAVIASTTVLGLYNLPGDSSAGKSQC